jgi:hypothetical protein
MTGPLKKKLQRERRLPRARLAFDEVCLAGPPAIGYSSFPARRRNYDSHAMSAHKGLSVGLDWVNVKGPLLSGRRHTVCLSQRV